MRFVLEVNGVGAVDSCLRLVWDELEVDLEVEGVVDGCACSGAADEAREEASQSESGSGDGDVRVASLKTQCTRALSDLARVVGTVDSGISKGMIAQR